MQLVTAAVILNQHDHERSVDDRIHRSISFPAKTLHPLNQDLSINSNSCNNNIINSCDRSSVEVTVDSEAIATCHPSIADIEADNRSADKQKGLKLRSIVHLDSMDRTSIIKKIDDQDDSSGQCHRPHMRRDGRLFPEERLYCEGLPKPKLRGVIHLAYALILPFGVYLLWKEANGNSNGQLAGIVFALSNLYCVGISALYHIGNWPKHTEILIQKFDHCGISIYAAGVNFPCSLMLMPGSSGIALLMLSVVSCAWTCFHILNNRPAVWRFVIVSMSIILYVPVLFYVMSAFEFSCGCLNLLIQGAGMMVFVAQKPDPWPTVFGYHELFHLICIVGMTVTFMCNWSIIRRTCNPYEVHADVLDLLEELIGQ